MRRIHGTIRLIASALALLLACPGTAMAAEASDAQVKAAFIFNFIRYVDWPEGVPAAAEPFVVCRVGNRSPLALALSSIEGRQVKGRELKLKQVENDATGCHALVFTEADAALLRRTQGKPILTVGDGWPFLDEGGMLALTVVDGKMAFGANLEAARHANLRLGSQMLKLARRIVEGTAK